MGSKYEQVQNKIDFEAYKIFCGLVLHLLQLYGILMNLLLMTTHK